MNAPSRHVGLAALLSSVVLGCGSQPAGPGSAETDGVSAAGGEAQPSVAPPPVRGGPKVEGHRAIGAAGCTIDAPVPTGDTAFGLLEVSGGLTAAGQRYEIFSNGIVYVSGLEEEMQREEVEPPEGAEEVGEMARSIEATGLYDLEEGCYGPSPASPDAKIETVVIKHDGSVYQFAVTNRQGPKALNRTIELMLDYLRAADAI